MPDSRWQSQIVRLSLELAFRGPFHKAGSTTSESVVISRKKAADTGSLLTHFICLALGLLSMKQMERNCIISRVERLSAAYLSLGSFHSFWLSFVLSAR